MKASNLSKFVHFFGTLSVMVWLFILVSCTLSRAPSNSIEPITGDGTTSTNSNSPASGVFDPRNPQHLRVSFANTPDDHIASIFVTVNPASSVDGNPTIFITRITNTGFSNDAPAIPSNWMLTVPANAAPNVFSTPDNKDIKIAVDNPVGITPTQVPLGNDKQITVTNLYSAERDDDDETITYNVTIIFEAGLGTLPTVEVTSTNVMNSPVRLSDGDTLTVTEACVALDPGDFAILIGGNLDPTYVLSDFRTYYDRSRRQQGDIIDANNITLTNVANIVGAEDKDSQQGEFTFITTFPPCLAEHLGSAKTGTNARKAYELSRAEHLEAVSYLVNARNAEYADKYYTLTADIDLGQVGDPWSKASGGAGFMPIGRHTDIPFKGNFDCAGYAISNLYINEPTVNHRGFFGSMNAGGNLSNCTLLNVAITGGSIVGGLVGIVQLNSIIDNSVVTGTVAGSGNRVGGLAGIIFSNSVIKNAYVMVTVTGSGNSVGGLVGETTTGVMIEGSCVRGTVAGSDKVGGLVGSNMNSSIKNSCALGTVEGRGSSVGGLVGWMQGTFKDQNEKQAIVINNSYATGSVTGSNNVGGLVGEIGGAAVPFVNSIMSNAYATGAVTGSNYIGGLIGFHATNTNEDLTNSYWNNSAPQTLQAADGATERKDAEKRGIGNNDDLATPTIGIAGFPMDELQAIAEGTYRIEPYFEWDIMIWLFGEGHYPALRPVLCANRQLDAEATTCGPLQQ